VRIALFTESYDPVINGVSTSVKTLAEELRLLGQSPEIVAPNFPGHRDTSEIPIRRMRSWRSGFNPQNPFAYPPSPIGTLPEMLRDCTPNIVHTQQPFGLGLHGRRLAKRRGIPLFSTFHTLYHEYTHYASFLPRPFLSWLLSRHFRIYYGRDCSRVIVPSRAAGQSLVRVGVPEHKLVVVPTGIPTARPVLPSEIEAARRFLGVDDATPILLYVGRLAREKNIEALFAMLAEAPDNAVLALVGGGPEVKAMQLEAERRGLAKRTRFTGPIPRADLPPIYSAAQIFTFPSTTETQGVVLSEAQSYGLPCVAADGGGAPEFVRDGVDGLVVPIDRLGRAVIELLNNEEQRRAFSLAARQSPLFPTPTEMARRILEIYRQAN
jgi:1,2-diacylglycerol 3-alpha-glucosyltransferase